MSDRENLAAILHLLVNDTVSEEGPLSRQRAHEIFAAVYGVVAAGEEFGDQLGLTP